MQIESTLPKVTLKKRTKLSTRDYNVTHRIRYTITIECVTDKFILDEVLGYPHPTKDITNYVMLSSDHSGHRTYWGVTIEQVLEQLQLAAARHCNTHPSIMPKYGMLLNQMFNTKNVDYYDH